MHTSHRWFLTIDRRVSARDATGPDAGTGNETSVRRCVRSSRVALPCSTTADQQAKIKAIVAEQEPRQQTQFDANLRRVKPALIRFVRGERRSG